MKFTDHYRLGSVVAGETLDPIEDSRRFLVIDRQLLGLFQVFGNGVVTGWDVSASSGLSVSISPGRGHIFFLSAVTSDVRTVTGLVPNARNYIYAQAIDTTRFDRDIIFISDTTLFNGSQLIPLAIATTNDTNVTSVDSSVRNDISFIEDIKNLINAHRHRGGPDNPTKIDLAKEVIGQLSGAHIDGLDASKIVSGRLPLARIPSLKHGDLLNSGVLTHAQLDSFVRDLANPNTRLLGELATTNMMQLYLAMKHIWNEVDAFTTNMLVMIPGISPDAQTDFVHSTAVIDKDNHLIQGVPSLSGELVTTTFRTSAAFSSARLKSSIEIGDDSTGAFVKLTKPFSELIVDSFDNVFQAGTSIPGWVIETVASSDATTFKSDADKKVDGAFSVKFNVEQSMRLQATKEFDDADWTPYNEIEAYIQTLSPEHGRIVFQILTKNVDTGLLEVLDQFSLIEPNEITNGFRKITRDITGATRNKVNAIRIYTDTGEGWDLSDFVVNIDRIRLNNNLFYNPSGRIRLRVRTPQKSQWAAISWTGDLNGGTIQSRARSAPVFESFDQGNSSTFSAYSDVSGNDPHIADNLALEIEIALTPSTDLTATPVLRTVTISYITNSVSSGLRIDTTDDFLRATKLENATVQSPGEVIIDGRNDTGDVVYGIQNSAQQVSLTTDAFGTSYGTPVVGLDGSSLPLSPLQASQTEFVLRQSGLEGVASVERQKDRTYLLADTLNDRILVLDMDGKLIKGIASNNVRNIEELYPLASNYNPTNGILYIAWSKNVSLASLNLNKFVLSGTGISMTLSNVSDSVVRVSGPRSQDASSNVSPILLSTAHQAQLAAFTADTFNSDHRLFLSVASDAAKEGVNIDNANFATLVGPRGLPVFVGDIKFVEGLFRPIHISITAAFTWLVGNAKPLLTDGDKDIITGVSVKDVASIVEIEPSTGQILFSDDSVDFSLLTLGGVVELNDRYIAAAGIVEDKGLPQASTTNRIKATVGGGVVATSSTVKLNETLPTDATVEGTVDATSTTTTTTDLDVLTKRRGRVKIVEKASGRTVFEQETSDGTYAADIQVDADGNLVTIEKSFSDARASGRVVKLDEDGNVFYQFGLAELASPNDVRVLSTGNLIVST